MQYFNQFYVWLSLKAAEVGAAWKALTIPVLEPLTADRMSQLCHIVMGCLMASVSVATSQSLLAIGASSSSEKAHPHRMSSSGPRDEEADACAVDIIEKSLELFNATLGNLRESSRAGGHVLQNFSTMGAWVLTTGLMVQLNNSSQVSEFTCFVASKAINAILVTV